MDKLIRLRKLDSGGFFNYTRKIIEQMTEVTNNHILTPELSLRLVTPKCYLWTANYQQCLLPDPFWAFYWPGGEALTRYLLDNKHIIHSKSVLDVGSGCGSLAIAAAKLGGATTITANDIDPIAAVAIQLNSRLNDCTSNSFHIVTDNIVGSRVSTVTHNCVLLGDMFYNKEFNEKLIQWLFILVKKGADIYIGDPNRHLNFFEDYREYVALVAEYEIPNEYKEINDLMKNTVNVWKMSAKL